MRPATLRVDFNKITAFFDVTFNLSIRLPIHRFML